MEAHRDLSYIAFHLQTSLALSPKQSTRILNNIVKSTLSSSPKILCFTERVKAGLPLFRVPFTQASIIEWDCSAKVNVLSPFLLCVREHRKY
jgi:hypothetical protein